MELLTKFIDYLSLEKNYSKHTITAYQKDIQDFFSYLEEEYQIVNSREVEYLYIRSWIVFLHQQNITNRSVNRKITALKSFYVFLLKIEEVDKNPLSNQKSLKTAKKVIIPFSEREVEEALLVQNDSYTVYEQKRNKLIIHFLYGTGIRQSEIIGLKLKDVDVKEKTIKVLGKRNKERIVPVYKEIIDNIEDYLLERDKLPFFETYFFVTKKGGKMYNALVYRVINSYFSKVSTKQKKSPHVLRHSYATDLVNNGADLNSVKELLGHSSLAATQVYTHNSLDKLKQVYNQAHPRSAKKK
ncbi:integrase/recombinase XerC [Wenyingzhuangia heitensis]|uniref:Integrase/recombinase XerC n=1 Tax=Wenyingzhuangia heitensis TaxID=1487859 RepID=A0ABX0UAR2_9FLAO|nr:tyrosine-type recombinase/integrase [Wenyingzhuangia heitensis]NIJ44661.1 integrase/recombinase XerC [Wenyingzhuangia heitensis]